MLACLVVAGMLLISASEDYSERVSEEIKVEKDKASECAVVIDKAIYMDTMRIGFTLDNGETFTLDGNAQKANAVFLVASAINIGDSVCLNGE